MRESIALYFKKRALRIFPPYYATLALILLVNTFVPLATWGRHSAGLTPTIPVETFLVNGLLLQDIFPAHNTINGPFWSIAVEWHIYFFLPVIVWALRRFGPLGPLLGCGIAGIGLTILSHKFSVTTPWYIGLFGMGFASAWFSFGGQAVNRREEFYRGALVLFSICSVALLALLWRYQIENIQSLPRYDNHLYLIDPLCGAVTAAGLACLSMANSENPVRRFLERKSLVTLGGFSYSLYLIHIPIIASLYQFGLDRGWTQRSGEWTLVVLTLIGGGISILLAWLFSQLVEKPFVGSKKKADELRPTPSGRYEPQVSVRQ